MEDSEEKGSPKVSNEVSKPEPRGAAENDRVEAEHLGGLDLSEHHGRSKGTGVPADSETDDQNILDRLRQLEARVAELEVGQTASARSADSAHSHQGHPDETGPEVATVGSPSLPGSTRRALAQGPPPPPVGAPLLTLPEHTNSGRSSERASRPVSEVGSEVLLKWAGLGLLFLAAVFLVGTAISRGWIGPQVQLAGAAVGGLALIGSGLRLRNVPGWTGPLVQVGFAVLYVCSGAAWDWLDLGSASLSTAIALGLTVHTVVLARHLRAWGIALVGLVGALTVSVWVDYYDVVGMGLAFAFIFGLVVLFTIVYLEQSWKLLWVLMVLATAMLVLIESHSTVHTGLSTRESVVRAGLLSVLGAVYWFAPVAWAFIAKRGKISEVENPDRMVQSSAVELPFSHEYRIALFVPVWLWTTVLDFDSVSDSTLTLVGAAIAFVAAVSALLTQHIVSRSFFFTQCLAASVMVSVVLVSLFDGPVLLAAFALQTAVLVGLARHVDDPWFAAQAAVSSLIVLIVSGSWMLWATADDVSSGKDTVNLAIIGLAIVLSMLERRWHARKPVDSEPSRTSSTDLSEAGLLACYGAAMLWVVGVFVHFAQGQAIVTAIWAVFAVLIIALALMRRSHRLLRLSLATISLVVVKLLTVDLAEVDAFVRVGLFFVIGLGLLALSYQLPRLMAPIAAGSDSGPETDQNDNTDP